MMRTACKSSFSQMNNSAPGIRPHRLSPMLTLLCIAALIFAAASESAAAEPITSVSAIRALTPEQGLQRLPVSLDGVVTFYHREWGVLFIHDGQDSICVGIGEDLRPATPYVRGARLHIEGVVGPGEFLPVVWPSVIRPDGAGALPEYRRITANEIFIPSLDCHPVEVDAVVKGTSFSDESLVVDLQIEGSMVRALLPQHETLTRLPWQLLERRVKVRGVVGTHFNDQRQMSGRLLFVQALDSFTIEEDAISDADVPHVPVESLLRVDSSLRQRVRIRGVATHVMPGRGLYLRGEGGSMFVQTAQPFEVVRGDEVEAEGFPVVTAFRPSLSALDVKKIGEGGGIVPVAFRPAEQRNSREQCELVTLDAELLEVTRSRGTTTLLCRADGEAFEAALASSSPPAEALAPGMKLRLTGICELVSTRPLVIPRNATDFRVQLRDAADVAIMARQPWWNEQRALWLLGIVAVLAVAVGAWAATLRTVVASQSAVIRQQAQQQATLEERQRIARDLHDTLEQELVGVNMLLDSTAMKLNGAHPEAGEPLGLARKLLRRAREESRTTIRELRSVALEQRGLPAALDELLRPLAIAGGATFSVDVSGTPTRLAGTLESHLLRIAQEAVANASRHSGAHSIVIKLDYSMSEVALEVRDDGTGFNPDEPTAEAGHFGLSGMKERADKISGKLHVVGDPGCGTTVRVTAPIVVSNKATQLTSPT